MKNAKDCYNMSESETNQFYSRLPLNRIPISKLVAEEEYFYKLPSSWYVIITDIKGSTKAVAAGLHQIVNLIATGSIIAALNIGIKKEVSIPFFFGGDGATILVPPSILDSTLQALREHSHNASENFNLDLRVGQVPVSEIYQNDQKILLAKACLGKNFAIPVILGNGLKYAEKVIKGRAFNFTKPTNGASMLNLEGMECRWDQIKPPQSTFEIVCLLVDVKDAEKHAPVFKKVLKKIDEIYGSPEQRNPISVSKLKLKATPKRIIHEMRTKLGRFQWSYLIKNFLLTFFGFVYFRFDKEGKAYLHKLVELSDTLVLDGRINTVISGTTKQRILLTTELERLEKDGDLFFGMHVSRESVMSCYVRNRDDQHIHFIDGSQGGYTQAASMLKKKLNTLGG